MIKKQDTLYASPLNNIVDFKFDEQVVDVFPDMIQRSVPGYALMIATIGVLAGKYSLADSHCYDLGCSLGAASLAMRQGIPLPGCEIIAVDNSPAMVMRARELFEDDENDNVPVNFVCADIEDVVIKNASVVVMNLTLQFIPPEERPALIQRIYDGLRPGGVLILSEKIAFDNPQQQELQTALHHEFKLAQGYSELEISQKRTALENVMVPETLECHQQRLRVAGFNVIDVWFQCLNFISLVAIK